MRLTIEIPREAEAVLIQEAAIAGENLQTLIEKMLREKASFKLITARTSEREFDRDMEFFAEDVTGSENYLGSYSRADIYFDHD